MFCLLGGKIAHLYRVESVAHASPLGVVYRGLELGSRLPIAIRCLSVPRSLDDAGRLQLARNLARETLITHRLSLTSRSIVRVLDVGTARTPCEDWFPFIAREWLEGETLRAFMSRQESRGLTLGALRRLLEPVALGLARCHELGFAHGAISPDSLFLVHNGAEKRLVLFDLGIASALADSTRLLASLAPEAESKLYDLRYAAPEQLALRAGSVGSWTDVFSFGLLVSELLSGRPALEGRAPLELAMAAANPLRRPTPRTLGANVPPQVELAVARALEPEPLARYATLRPFWAALNAGG